MSIYNPVSDKYLSVANVMTRNGQKNVRLILDIDTNIFYTLDDDNNFRPLGFQQPALGFYISNNTGTTNITSADTWTDINFTSNPVEKYNVNNDCFYLQSGAVILYSSTTIPTRWIKVEGHIEVANGNNQEIDISLFLNDNIQPESISSVVTSSGGKSTSLPGLSFFEVNNGDTFKIRVKNKTGTQNVDVKDLTVLITCL